MLITQKKEKMIKKILYNIEIVKFQLMMLLSEFSRRILKNLTEKGLVKEQDKWEGYV